MKKLILPLAAAAAISSSAVSMAASHGKMPFSGPDSVAYAQQLWDAMGAAGLVGGALGSAPYKGVHPHGAVLTTDTSEVKVGDYTGKLIVKKNFGGEGVSMEAVNADAAKYLKAVTVMFKREAGYDADNQDWFWAKYKADGNLDVNDKGMQLAGRVAKGKPVGCISCHTAAPGGDYIFTN